MGGSFISWGQNSYINHVEFCTNLSLPLLVITFKLFSQFFYQYVLMDIYFIIRHYFTYSIALIIPDLATGSSFSWLPCPLHTNWLQSCLTLCNPMNCTADYSPLSMKFPRQDYWNGLPLPPPGDLPDPGIEPESYIAWIGRRVLYHSCQLGSPVSIRYAAIKLCVWLFVCSLK